MAGEDDSRRGPGLSDTQVGEPNQDTDDTNEDAHRDESRDPAGRARTDPAESLPRILEGRWRLEREIGAGGMGQVFEARHLTLGHRVAVKLLHPHRLAAPEAVHRFLREARLAGVAGHPGIARVFDFDLTADGTPYMVMELLAGETLEARLDAPARIGLADGLDVLVAVLETLDAIHAAGVVHRDIKPGNIFVLAEPGPLRTKLLDFGLARGADPLGTDANLTRTGQVLGTPHYMSPEQARGLTQVGPEADLWAIGVILYEVATGQRPFPGENYNEALANILTRDPPPVRELVPGLPAALGDVLRRSFARDPDRRYRSAGELRRALAALRLDLARARPPPPVRRGRRRLLLAGAVLAVAAAAGILALGRGAPAPAASLRITWSPYRDAPFLAGSTRWLLDALGTRIGHPVEFVPAASYEDSVALLLRGEVDAAGLSPASYVHARAMDRSLVLLARIQSNGADTYQAILFTRSTSPVREIADVRGRSFCFVDPSSTSGFVYPRAMLRRAGIEPERDLGQVLFAGDHERVIALVAAGRCEVAGSSTSALTQWAEEAGLSPATFRILAASDSIPGDALVARSGLDPDLLARLRAAADALVADTAARRFPADREISGLVAADDHHYDAVRALIDARP